MPLAERLALLNPQGDEPSRDRRAEYGSSSNPAEFASVAGGLVAVGRRPADGAQRSSLGRARDAELLRAARANNDDPFMRSQIAGLHSRQKMAVRAQAERAAVPVPAGRRESGTGWPARVRDRLAGGGADPADSNRIPDLLKTRSPGRPPAMATGVPGNARAPGRRTSRPGAQCCATGRQAAVCRVPGTRRRRRTPGPRAARAVLRARWRG